MPTNFHLAPPAKLVDGLFAVPIDIQSITASFLFDGATQTATSDATLTFVMPDQSGCPLFDLRQPITAAWLDGAAIPVAQVAHHDVGGGPNAELRILNATLPANTTHTLRVTYQLGLPQASTAGSYQPQLSWTAGPRLRFNFGFTDLGAGRYLEAWIPANLIFDQFDLTLSVRVINTAIAHSLITNGTVTTLATNHWSVVFPGRFTALSPLLELRATDSLTHATDTVLLPGSGTTVTLDAWKLATSSVNLPAQLALLKTYLADNETRVGKYTHGNRFVAFFNVGGMEYDGGTTTGTDALKHEAFHSWWARGIKPASQPDAWFDEGWTTYFSNEGGTVSTPFDFAQPPVELHLKNPYARITATGAYTAGSRFWRGVSALIGNDALGTFMRDFYQQFSGQLIRSVDLETYLLSRSGNATLVDAFHRFVYGFANPATPPDLWLKDDTAHTNGQNDWNGRFWDSPDLWVRRQDDGGTTHQAPEFGQDNWFYARVRNRGTVSVEHFVVSFNVKSFAGTEFTYPADFLPCTAAAGGFTLAPGQTTIVKARWPKNRVPAAGTHVCLTAAVITRGDHPQAGKHVWEHNNLAQKNLTVVDLQPGQFVLWPFVLANRSFPQKRAFSLEIFQPATQKTIPVRLLHNRPDLFTGADHVVAVPPSIQPAADRQPADDEHLDCAAHPTRHELTDEAQVSELVFPVKSWATMRLRLASQDQLLVHLRVALPPDVFTGQSLRFDAVQRDVKTGKIMGGVALSVRVVNGER